MRLVLILVSVDEDEVIWTLFREKIEDINISISLDLE